MMKIGLLGLNALEQSAICAWGHATCAIAVWLPLAPEAPIHGMDALVCSLPASQRHSPWPDGLPVALLHNEPTGWGHRHNGSGAVVMIDTGQGQPAVLAALNSWLANAIRMVHGPAGAKPALALRDRQRFSRRETEVLDLLSQGLSNDQISASLNIRTATVKTYLRRIFERTGALNRTHAVSLYRQARPGQGSSAQP